MFITWSGDGYLVPVITFASCLGTELATNALLGDRYYQEHAWPIPLALTLASSACYAVGRQLNSSKPRDLRDPGTGEYPPRHSFFFINVEYWGLILLVIAFFTLFSRILGG